MLAGLIAVGLVTACVIVVGTADASARRACQSRGAEPPNVGSGNNYLKGVAVTSTCNAWAVGYYHKGTDYLALIERFNGKAWKLQPSPSRPPNARLFGVAATSASNAWAVGQGPGGALIEHWNGKAWKIQRSHGGGLSAVAATSAKNAWAAGQGPGRLIEHWNGKAWKPQASPCPQSADECDLWSVAATSAKNAWAVGSYTVHSNDVKLMLIEHWNGKAWKIQPSPNPAGDATGALTGVAAVSATRAWAVGSYFHTGVGPQMFIERWNGKAWKIQSSPSPTGAKSSELDGVAATSAKNAWAVGDIDFTNGMGKTLVERWNGTTWKVQRSPNPGSKSNALYGVATSSAKNAWAVGDYYAAITRPPSRALALLWNGRSWAR